MLKNGKQFTKKKKINKILLPANETIVVYALFKNLIPNELGDVIMQTNRKRLHTKTI